MLSGQLVNTVSTGTQSLQFDKQITQEEYFSPSASHTWWTSMSPQMVVSTQQEQCRASTAWAPLPLTITNLNLMPWSIHHLLVHVNLNTVRYGLILFTSLRLGRCIDIFDIYRCIELIDIVSKWLAFSICTSICKNERTGVGFGLAILCLAD